MRTVAIFKRIIKEIFTDKRTLALVFLAPLVIMTMLFLILQNNDQDNIKVACRNLSTPLVKELDRGKQLSLTKIRNNHSAGSNIKKYNFAAFIEKSGTRIIVYYQDSDNSQTAIVKQKLLAGINKLRDQKIQKLLAKAVDTKALLPTKNVQVEQTYLYAGADSNIFVNIAPSLIGFFVFLFVFLISGISLLQERTSGTLERLLISPVKRSEIIIAYLLAYGSVAVIQTTLTVTYSIYILGIHSLGPIWLVFLTNILLSAVALLLGLLVSTLANSEFQMIQFIPILIVPQAFFSGIFNLENMTPIWQTIARIFPLYYGGDALTAVIKKGQGLSYTSIDLLILCLFTILLLFANVVGLKRYRRV